MCTMLPNLKILFIHTQGEGFLSVKSYILKKDDRNWVLPEQLRLGSQLASTIQTWLF